MQQGEAFRPPLVFNTVPFTPEKIETLFYLYLAAHEDQRMRNHVLRDMLKMARSTDSHSINLGIRQNITPVRIMCHTSEAESNPKPAVRIPVRMKMNPNRSKILAATPAVMSQRHCMTHRTMITGSSSAFAVSFRIQYMSFTRNISSPSLSPAGSEPAGYNAIVLTAGLMFSLDRSATAIISLKVFLKMYQR